MAPEAVRTFAELGASGAHLHNAERDLHRWTRGPSQHGRRTVISYETPPFTSGFGGLGVSWTPTLKHIFERSPKCKDHLPRDSTNAANKLPHNGFRL